MSTTFEDKNEHEWELTLTVGALRRLRERAGLDLNKALGGSEGLAELLFADQERLCMALWVLVEKQAAAAGITREHFEDSFDGETAMEAIKAMLEAVANFSPFSAVSKTIRAKLPQLLDQTNKAIEQELTKRADEAISTLSKNAGSSPESPALTPPG